LAQRFQTFSRPAGAAAGFMSKKKAFAQKIASLFGRLRCIRRAMIPNLMILNEIIELAGLARCML
jgi:hypothetical protein